MNVGNTGTRAFQSRFIRVDQDSRFAGFLQGWYEILAYSNPFPLTLRRTEASPQSRGRPVLVLAPDSYQSQKEVPAKPATAGYYCGRGTQRIACVPKRGLEMRVKVVGRIRESQHS